MATIKKPVEDDVQLIANEELPVEAEADTVPLTVPEDEPFHPTGEGGSYIAVGGGKVIRAR